MRHDAFGSEPIAMIDAGVAGAKVSTYYSSNSTIGVPMLVTLDKKTTYIEFMIDGTCSDDASRVIGSAYHDEQHIICVN